MTTWANSPEEMGEQAFPGLWHGHAVPRGPACDPGGRSPSRVGRGSGNGVIVANQAREAVGRRRFSGSPTTPTAPGIEAGVEIVGRGKAVPFRGAAHSHLRGHPIHPEPNQLTQLPEGLVGFLKRRLGPLQPRDQVSKPPLS